MPCAQTHQTQDWVEQPPDPTRLLLGVLRCHTQKLCGLTTAVAVVLIILPIDLHTSGLSKKPPGPCKQIGSLCRPILTASFLYARRARCAPSLFASRHFRLASIHGLPRRSLQCLRNQGGENRVSVPFSHHASDAPCTPYLRDSPVGMDCGYARPATCGLGSLHKQR